MFLGTIPNSQSTMASSMFLGTIPNCSARRNLAVSRVTNDVSDIAGAKPRSRQRFTNKPNLHQTQDIRGASSSVLHRATNKPDAFATLDIPGAQSDRTYMHTSRCVDPQDPIYPMPGHSERVPQSGEPAQPKFLRCTLAIDDIEGTKPKKYFKWKERSTSLNVDDIEGAKPRWKWRRRAQGTARPDSLCTKDINETEFRTKRVSDSLNPVYKINGMVIKDDGGCKPKQTRQLTNVPFFSLQSSDIAGATCSYRRRKLEEARRQYRVTNIVSDIKNAQADSLHRGLKTLRVTNPLNPKYVSLDGSTLGGSRCTTPGERGSKKKDATSSLSSAARHVLSGGHGK